MDADQFSMIPIEAAACELLLEPPRAVETAVLFLGRVADEYEVRHRLCALLSADERARFDRLADPGRRLQFASSRIVLRFALSHLTDHRVSPSAWRIVHSCKGQPRLASPTTARHTISLSYSKDLFAIAVTPSGRVGVDIETLTQFPAAQMPWHLLAESEIAHLQGLPRGLQREWFMRLWTVKEAVSKSWDKGSFADFAAIDVLDCVIDCRATRGPASFQGGTICHEDHASGTNRYVLSLSMPDTLPRPAS